MKVVTIKDKKSTKLLKMVENMDIYGEAITLRYKGKDKFQTSIGDFLSLIIMTLTVAYFSFKLHSLIERTQTQLKKNTVMSMSNSDLPEENISSKNITVAFKLSDVYST